MFQGVGVSEVAARGEEELCVVSVSASRTELGKAMGGIWPTAHEGANGNRFGGKVGEDIKWMGQNNIREARDYGDAVPGIGCFEEEHIIRGRRREKSRGSVRT